MADTDDTKAPPHQPRLDLGGGDSGTKYDATAATTTTGAITLTKKTTYDAVINIHELTEDKLWEVINMNRNTSWDIALTCIGIVIGFAQNFLSAIDAVNSNLPISAWDAIGSCIFLLGVGVGTYSGVHWFRGKGDLKEAIRQLKSRPTRTEALSAQS